MEKIGRNDPCPCGSGKKFKKCCANKPLGPRKITVQKAGVDFMQRMQSATARISGVVPELPKSEEVKSLSDRVSSAPNAGSSLPTGNVFKKEEE